MMSCLRQSYLKLRQAWVDLIAGVVGNALQYDEGETLRESNQILMRVEQSTKGGFVLPMVPEWSVTVGDSEGALAVKLKCGNQIHMLGQGRKVSKVEVGPERGKKNAELDLVSLRTVWNSTSQPVWGLADSNKVAISGKVIALDSILGQC